jgi:hypothetical protein
VWHVSWKRCLKGWMASLLLSNWWSTLVLGLINFRRAFSSGSLPSSPCTYGTAPTCRDVAGKVGSTLIVCPIPDKDIPAATEPQKKWRFLPLCGGGSLSNWGACSVLLRLPRLSYYLVLCLFPKAEPATVFFCLYLRIYILFNAQFILSKSFSLSYFQLFRTLDLKLATLFSFS